MSDQTEIEVKAREMGWSPKEEFRGDPGKWIDADIYVERGETLMPLIKATNRRLNEQVTELTHKLTKAAEELAISKDSIEALKEFNNAANRKTMKESVVKTRDALIEAKREGNPEAEVELQEKLNAEQAALREAEESGGKEAPKKKEKEAKPNGAEEVDYTKTKEWKDWVADNTWYSVDKRRTALSFAIADEIRSNPETASLRGRAFLDKVADEVEIAFTGRSQSKVEGGTRGSGGGGGGGKSYADLPKEAKEACESQANRLVGPSRAFKTVEEWRKHYAQEYFSQEQS